MACTEDLKGLGEGAVAVVYHADLSSETRCLEKASDSCDLLKDPASLLVLLVTASGKVFKVFREDGGGLRSRRIDADARSLVYPGADPMKIRALDRLVPLKDLYKAVCGGW